jgi:hypothetical protein
MNINKFYTLTLAQSVNKFLLWNLHLQGVEVSNHVHAQHCNKPLQKLDCDKQTK